MKTIRFNGKTVTVKTPARAASAADTEARLVDWIDRIHRWTAEGRSQLWMASQLGCHQTYVSKLLKSYPKVQPQKIAE